jgi:hypothetical protein
MEKNLAKSRRRKQGQRARNQIDPPEKELQRASFWPAQFTKAHLNTHIQPSAYGWHRCTPISRW